MAKKRYTPETIIRKLREAEVLQGQGQTIAQVVKQLGITEQTFYRWRKEYGGMRVAQMTADVVYSSYPLRAVCHQRHFDRNGSTTAQAH